MHRSTHHPALLAAFILVAAAPAAGAGPPPAIPDLMSGTETRALVPANGALRTRSVDIRAEVLDRSLDGADRIRIELFDDTVIVAQLDRLRRTSEDYFTWVGSVAEAPGSRVVLVNTAGRVAGMVWIGSRVFEIAYSSGGGQTVAEALPRPVARHEVARTDLAETAPSVGPTRTRPTVIDVVIAYTRKARARAGGTNGIEALAMLAVEGMNDALQASEIDVVFRLIHVGMVDYTETADAERDLTNLAETDMVSQAKAWRNRYGADVVMLLTGKNYGGAAELPGHYSVVGVGGPGGASSVSHVVMTAAHMWGHNLGAGGERDGREGCGIADHSCAHTDPAGQFATIMSHGEGCDDCLIAPLFSNPDVDFGWLDPPVFGGGIAFWDPADVHPDDGDPRPAGRAGRADNARTISRFAPAASQWRPTLTPLKSCRGVVATWVGTNGNDTFRGSDGSDVVVAKGGNDRIETGAGADMVCGGPGRDQIDGGGGDDFLYGEGGRDTIRGEGGDDLLDGGPSADDLFGGSGDDVIRGGEADDDIWGGAGDDAVDGGTGDDEIRGGGGDDRLSGGAGDDLLDGGRGADWLQPDPGDRFELG